MSNLYELTGNQIELREMADELDPQAYKDTFEALEGAFNDKAVSVTHVIHNLQDDVDAVDAEINRLQARKKALSNKRDNIREYLRSNMEASGVSKIECPLFVITLAKGRDAVVIDNEEAIDDKYVEVKVQQKVNKAELLKALKEGAVEGAHIEKSKSSLRIK